MLFDAHNHIHLGPSKLSCIVPTSPLPLPFAGMAVMSTHPRDFDVVTLSCSTLKNKHGLYTVPCYGVHPWFLHEMKTNEGKIDKSQNNHDQNDTEANDKTFEYTLGIVNEEDDNDDDSLWWLHEIKTLLSKNDNACVGEIGLDGARWTNPQTKELCTPMDTQQHVFELQLQIASEMNRPVSIHVVHAWGPFFESIKRVKQKKKKSVRGDNSRALPSKMYLHAFGGKPMVVNQIIKACNSGGGKPMTKLFFGFAPCINFRSHRVGEVIKAVGIDRILLETDLENGSRVYNDLCVGAELIADTLNLSVDEVLQKTFANAQDFYGFTHGD